MKFTVCIPDFDETAWHEVEDDQVLDAESAAEHHVREKCARDAENYASFEGDGLLVLVRPMGRGGTTVAVNVTAEMVPSITARRLQ